MTIAPPDNQLVLLPTIPSWNITKNAQARNAYGSAAQEIVCATLQLTPIRVSGSYDVCFDAFGAGTYYEIKSVKHNGKIVIYDWRREKEVRAGVASKKYAVLCHRAPKSNGKRLIQELTAAGLELFIMNAALIHELATRGPLHTLQSACPNPRSGYHRHGYKDGYRNVPVSALRKASLTSETIQCRLVELEFSVTLHTVIAL